MSRIINDVGRLQAYNPYHTIEELELDNVIERFITLVWLVKDKKLTKTTFFVEIVENDAMRTIFKNICGCCNDVELYRELLIRYPSISESKFVKNAMTR